MKKMLYLMHVPWGWAKQRPHFLAEELSNFFDVTVMYNISYHFKGYVKNTVHNNLHIKKMFYIPYINRIPLLKKINNVILRQQIKILNYFNFNSIAWITHPNLYKYIIDTNFESIIYDCMDDALEFPAVQKNKEQSELLQLEEQLCKRSKLIICSSDHLKYKLICRYSIDKNKIRVVNNGIKLSNLSLKINLPQYIKKYFEGITKKIVYIGTISEWFDFDLIIDSLDKIQNIQYLLFGPKEVQIPLHKSITYGGPIPHEYVASVMSIADVLVMPFKVTELIKGVNPVKVYEYIYSNKPSLIVEYPETKKFDDFVYLYNSNYDYINKLKYILMDQAPKLISSNEKNKFLKENDWSSRTNEIMRIFNEFNV